MKLGVLGPLLVADDAGNDVPIVGPRLRTLLAALLVRANRTVSTDELIEIVWDGAPPDGATRTLRSYVMRLRRSVGTGMAGRIVTQAPGYRCHVAVDELDVLRFLELCDRGAGAFRAEAWHDTEKILSEALALWRGDPLADISSRILRDEYVERWELTRLQAVEWRIEAEIELGRHQHVVSELRLLAREQPLREHIHAQLILALYRCGRQAEALRAYQDAHRILVDELGLEPGPELRELHHRILTGDPTLTAPPADHDGGEATHTTRHAAAIVPRQLPPAVAHFTGRGGELAALSALLDHTGAVADAATIVAIDGTAGVGKTALAVHWAHRVADSFPDGQLFVNLRGFDPGAAPVDSGTAVRRLLEAFDVPAARIPADVDGQVALLRSRTAGRRVLIVLDNAHDVEQIRPLLPGSAGCLVLVTSRNQLTGLIALDGATPMTLDLFTVDEARQLLVRRWGADVLASREHLVDELIRLCARLPLALNIAAARVALSRTGHLEHVVGQLRDTRHRLAVLTPNDVVTGVRGVFTWSYRLLDPDAARMFRLLSVHPGPDIGVPAAARLAAVDRDEARLLLDTLAAAHLLDQRTVARYECHDLLRVYAGELSAAQDTDTDRRHAFERVLDHYLHTAHAAFRLLYPGHTALELQGAPGVAGDVTCREDALAWYADEHNCVVASVVRAEETRCDRHAWQIAWALAAYLIETGRAPELAKVSESALAAARRTGDLAAQAQAHVWLGDLLSDSGDHAGAHVHLQQAIDLRRRLDDPAGQARVLIVLAVLLGREGRHAEALRHGQEALLLFTARGDVAGQASALNAVGWFHAVIGEYQQALTQCRQALDLGRTIGDVHIEAATMDSIGFVHHQLRDYDQAVADYSAALRLRQSVGDSYYETEALAHLGETYRALGRTADARDAWRQALAILERIDDPQADDIRARLAHLEDS